MPVQAELIECPHHKFASLCPEAHCTVRDVIKGYEDEIEDLEREVSDALRSQDETETELGDYRQAIEEIRSISKNFTEEARAKIAEIIERYEV